MHIVFQRMHSKIGQFFFKEGTQILTDFIFFEGCIQILNDFIFSKDAFNDIFVQMVHLRIFFSRDAFKDFF